MMKEKNNNNNNKYKYMTMQSGLTNKYNTCIGKADSIEMGSKSLK
jgi:hypothetical protein